MVKLLETLTQENFKSLLKSNSKNTDYKLNQSNCQEAYKTDHYCDSCLTCDGCNRAPVYDKK